MERAAKGHKDVTGNIARKREKELKDDHSRMDIQAVTELLEREAQSPSKDDYKPPGNRGFFNVRMQAVFGHQSCGVKSIQSFISMSPTLKWHLLPVSSGQNPPVPDIIKLGLHQT